MFKKQPQIRRFNYSPRFYKAEAEEAEQSRIKFRRLTNRAPLQRRPFWWQFLLIVIILFLIYFVFKKFTSDSNDFLLEDVKIEVVE
jgi:type VI protein secretion system component VasF